jgi:flagellin FlaB
MSLPVRFVARPWRRVTVKKLVTLFRRVTRDEQGITGLETAIILIAFVVVATVFAFVVLTTGVFSSERGKETVFAGLNKARGSMEVRGGVVLTASGTPLAVDNVQFSVATSAGGDPVPLDPAATNNRTVIAYRDGTVVDDDVTYTTTEIVGDADTLLEPGELFVIEIDPAAMTVPPTLDPNDRFTLEIQTPVGAVLDITRQLPAEIDAVMQLH